MSFCIVNDDIDLVFQEGVLFGRGRSFFVGGSRLAEALQVLVERFFHFLEVLVHFGLAKRRRGIGHRLPNKRPQQRAFQGRDGFFGLAAQAQDVGKDPGQLGAQGGVLGLQVAVALRRKTASLQQLLELGHGHQPPFDHRRQLRCQRQVALVPQQAKVRLQATLELLEQPLLAPLRLAQALLLAPLEALAGQHARDLPAQGGQQAFHRLFERLALASRQNEQARAVGVFEVVDVAQVGGRRALAAPGGQQLLHRRQLAGASGAADVNVVADFAQLHPQRQGLAGPLLADDARQRRHLGGGAKGQLFRIARPA